MRSRSWLFKPSNLKERLRALIIYPTKALEKAFIPKREAEAKSSKSPKTNPTDWLFKEELLFKANKTKIDKGRFGLIPFMAKKLTIVVWKRRDKINNTVQTMKFRILFVRVQPPDKTIKADS